MGSSWGLPDGASVGGMGKKEHLPREDLTLNPVLPYTTVQGRTTYLLFHYLHQFPKIGIKIHLPLPASELLIQIK